MKKLLSLVVACLMLVSCFALTASAATEFTFTASAADEAGVFGLTFASPVALKKVGFTIDYDATKVVLLDADKNEVTGTSAGAYFTTEILGLHDTDKSKAFEGFFSVDVSATSNDGITDPGDMVTVYFKLVDGAKIEANPFAINSSYSKGYGGINCTGSKSTETYRISKGTAEGSIDWEALKPAVEEPTFSATAAGTTITCAGKVDATVSNYGVIFDTNAVGTRAQKYYGAMPGDTVLDYNGSTTFTFGDWDGTFEIVLEGVSAGSKTLNFFANDTIIADTTFTVVAE